MSKFKTGDIVEGLYNDNRAWRGRVEVTEDGRLLLTDFALDGVHWERWTNRGTAQLVEHGYRVVTPAPETPEAAPQRPALPEPSLLAAQRAVIDDLRQRNNRLSDEAGSLRTERDELLRENAVLRRTIERRASQTGSVTPTAERQGKER